MQLSSPMQKAINDQIRREFASEYVYLAMSAWFAQRTLDGFANWMRIQAGDEHHHARKLFEYLLDRGGSVTLQAIDAPPSRWKTTLAVFEEAKRHEAMVSASIGDLYARAAKELDYPTQAMLQWFLTEQVEEEKTAREIVAKFNLAKEDPAILIDLDRELGHRGAAEE